MTVTTLDFPWHHVQSLAFLMLSNTMQALSWVRALHPSPFELKDNDGAALSILFQEDKTPHVPLPFASLPLPGPTALEAFKS